MKHLLAFLLLFLMCSCSSINCLNEEHFENKTFAGTWNDVKGTSWLISTEPAWGVLALCDLPLSLVADTLLLPYSIPHDLSDKKEVQERAGESESKNAVNDE